MKDSENTQYWMVVVKQAHPYTSMVAKIWYNFWGDMAIGSKNYSAYSFGLVIGSLLKQHISKYFAKS